ncbi:MAG: AMP-dependent synthetase and ligase [Acidimicrobiales bacterium]|nr:AMP-dependent synthetase and ligase [Acidimicrobiales bacterium]
MTSATPGSSAPGPGLTGPPLEEVGGLGATTMTGFLGDVAARYGPNEALVFDDPLAFDATVRWSYDDVHHHARRVARALRVDGVRPGDRVAVLMGNRPEAVAALFGIAITGAVPVMLSTFAPMSELTPMVMRAEVSVLLTQTALLSRRFPEEFGRARADLPLLRTVVAAGGPQWEAFLGTGDAASDLAVDASEADGHGDDEGLVIFSSGSTDTPKGMVHDRRAPALQFWFQARIFRRDVDTRMWAALPIFWTAGLNSAMGATLAAGGCWVMQETFEPGAALALLERERVTEPYSLPHQTAALAEHADWAGTDLSSLRCVYGKSAFARHPSVDGDTTWNNPVGYGLSETCAFFSAHDASTSREQLRASHGRLLPGNEARVIDPTTGALLGPDTDGELVIKGPTLMVRYLGTTPGECFDDDGWFHTGDIGRYDLDGNLHYVGRRTEMIKTGGANVSPAEVEVQLRACAPVKVARVIGLPDDRLGEVVVACITLAEGAEAGADDIKAFLRSRVSSYKVPKHVLFFDDGEIPMTSSGSKVHDPELAALAAGRLATSTQTPTVGGPT